MLDFIKIEPISELKYYKILLLFVTFVTVSFYSIGQKEKEEWHQLDRLLDSLYDVKINDPGYKALLDSVHKKCIDIGYKEGEGEAKKFLGIYYSEKGNHELGRKNIVFAVQIFKRLGLPETDIASSYLDIGNTWYREGKLDNAMRKYLDAMRVFEKHRDSSKMVKGYANIGTVHIALEQYQKAEGYLIEMLEVAENLKDTNEIAHANNLLGNLFQSQGDLKTAESYFKKALEINLKINNHRGVAHSYNNFAILQYYEGNLDGALAYFKRALDKRMEINNPIPISESYRNIGSLYYFENDYENAVEYFRKGLKVAKKANALGEVANGFRFLSDAFKQLKKYDSSLHYLEQYQLINDSILKQDKIELVTDLEFKYNNERLTREKNESEYKRKLEALENDQLNRENASTKFKLTLLIILFVLLLILAGYITYTSMVKSKLNKSLQQQKKKLEEKNEIIQIKNNEIISSIEYAQNLQTSLLPSKDSYAEYFDEVMLFFNPRDIVSGDFYWNFRNKDTIYFAVGDCTGHGVPGAMLSVMSLNILNNIVRSNRDINTADFLNQLNDHFTEYLYNSHHQTMDGMDITLCKYNCQTKVLEFSGAVNSLLHFSKGEIHEFKTNRKSIGGLQEESFQYEKFELQLTQGECVFLYSDGYQDQFGGKNGKKFRRQNFRKLLKKVGPFSADTKEKILEETLSEWQSGYEQVDDILVMGFQA